MPSLRFLKNISINKAIAHHLDHITPEKIISHRTLKLSKDVHDYLCEHVIAVSKMSAALPCRFYEDLFKDKGTVAGACHAIFDEHESFVEMSGKIAERLFLVMGSNKSLTPGLVIILSATNNDAKEDFVAIIKMERQPVFTEERKETTTAEPYIELAINPANLVYPGKHIQKCALIKKEHTPAAPEILMVDKQSRDALIAGFFHEHFLQSEYCRDSHFRTKRFVREFVKWANNAKKEHRIGPEELDYVLTAARGALRQSVFNAATFIQENIVNRGEQNDCIEYMAKKNVDSKFETEEEASKSFRKKKCMTLERGVKINMPSSTGIDKEFFNIQSDPEDQTISVITIRTRKCLVT
jgi:hypothetical protein